MNGFRRMISCILGILLLFFVPVLYCSLKQEVLNEQVLLQESNLFLENVSKQGRITEPMLSAYIQKISHGHDYEVRLTHKKCSMEPEYRVKTLDEILMNQRNNYKGENSYTYVEVNTELPYVKQEEPSIIKMNTETNETVQKTYPMNSCDKDHVHTSECYTGHFHEGQPKFTYRHSHSSSCSYVPTSRFLKYYCNTCKRQILDCFWQYNAGYLDGNEYNPDSPNYQAYCSCGNRITDYEKVIHYIYDCGFSKDVDGDTIYDIIPPGEQEYPNYSSEPQILQAPTHRCENGCYRYHMSIEIEDEQVGGAAAQGKSKATATGSAHYEIRQLMSMINHSDQKEIHENLCYVPRYFIFTVRGEGKEYAPYRAYSYNVTYELILPEDGGEPYFQYESSNVMHPDSNTPWLEFHEWKLMEEDAAEFRMYIDNKKLSYYEYSFPKQLSVSKVYRYISDDRYDEIFDDACTLYQNGKRSYPRFCEDDSLIDPEKKYEIVKTKGRIELCNQYGKKGWERVCDKDEDGHLACHEKIRSIVATHPQQSIYQGEALVTTLLITFLDGSTKIVIGTCGLDTNLCGKNQRASLYYQGMNLLGELQDYSVPVMVDIIPISKRCARGHNYWLTENGKIEDCPFCKAWLESLILLSPSGAYIEIQQGTTLEENGIRLFATYLDGRKEYVTKGYIDNLDSSYIGLEMVTIGYKGMKVSLQVKVQPKRKLCTICGKHYELYPDGSDPSCPYCLLENPVFTGKVLSYPENVTMEEILQMLEEQGEYTLIRGDELYLTMRKQTDTLADQLLRFVGFRAQFPIQCEAVIRVRDEPQVESDRRKT